MALVQQCWSLGPFETNAYLVHCDRTLEAAVIDVGFEADRIARVVRELGVNVRYLLNTHAHYDHVAAMWELQQAVGGSYWLHPEDRFLLNGLTQQGAAFGLPPSLPPPEVNDLADGQRIPLGEQELQVFHTPGHSPGSVTFRWKGWLWVGDLLFAGSIGRTDLPGGNFETLVQSVRAKLFPLGDALDVYSGHGPPTTLGTERLGNPFVGDQAFLA